MSPVYDVLPTVLYIQNDDLGLNLHGSKRFDIVTPDSFRILGERSGYGAEPAKKRAKAAVERVLDHWAMLETYLTSSDFASLSDRLGSLQLVRG